jgi:hypothetical protein
MLLNSLDFAIFLPIVFLLYWFVFQKHLRVQNALITAASYLFYGWWDWRFLSLILFIIGKPTIMGKPTFAPVSSSYYETIDLKKFNNFIAYP